MSRLRHALSSLIRARGFLAASVLVLALGLGATLAVLAQLDQLVLRPLHFPKSERLVEVRATDLRTGRPGPISLREVQSLQEGSASTLDLIACTSRNRTLLGLDEPLQVNVGLVTGNFFSTLGVKPALGRVAFSREEAAAHPSSVAVLSHALWMERFGGAPDVVGRMLRLDGHGTVIVGVLPPEFRFPIRVQGCEVFLPEAVPFGVAGHPGMQTYRVAARLREGVELAQAASRVASAASQTARPGGGGFRASLHPLAETAARQTSPVLYPLLGAVGLLLLIAVFNVASLQLARNLARERELAVRGALGAGFGKIAWGFLLESLVVAALAGLLGTVLSLLFQVALRSLAPVAVHVRLDLFQMLAALALILVTSLALALASALQARRVHPARSLQGGARGTAGRGHRLALRALVIAELALSVALLVGTGRLLGTVMELRGVRPGFATERVMVARIPLPPAKYGAVEAQRAFLDALGNRLRALPGVAEVGMSDTVPFVNPTNGGFASASPAPGAAQVHMFFHVVTPTYFRAMDIPFQAGRSFLASERDACVISRRLAEALWPGERALGRAVYGADRPLTVVGVVEEVMESDLQGGDDPQLYVSALDNPLFEGAVVALRVQGKPGAYAGPMREAVRQVDPALAIPELRPLADAVAESYADRRSTGLLFAGFGAAALLLACFGLFGLLSQGVQRRTREFGIRAALGAGPSRIVRLVAAEAALLVGAGLSGGLALAWGLGRHLESLLFQMQKSDPSLFALVALVLGLAGLSAFLLPALRAARLHPADALRSE